LHDSATAEPYTRSLHDALPICLGQEPSHLAKEEGEGEGQKNGHQAFQAGDDSLRQVGPLDGDEDLAPGGDAVDHAEESQQGEMAGEAELARAAGFQVDGKAHDKEDQAVTEENDDFIGPKELLKQFHDRKKPPSLLALLP